MIGGMGIDAVLARIAQIDQIVNPRPAAPAAATVPATTAAPASAGSFATSLASSLGSSFAAPLAGVTGVTGVPAAAGGGLRALAVAQGEVGQAEMPPGSNDSPRIAQYRQAVGGAGVGPWCAYFASWCAAQAGVPLGEVGQGLGSVGAVWDWGQRTGRALPAGSRPSPGDLVVWGGEHVGIVEGVDPDGSIHTIEGNSSNAVSRRTYGPDGGGATGYVRLG
jgi:hypothetical protein